MHPAVGADVIADVDVLVCVCVCVRRQAVNQQQGDSGVHVG